VGAARPCLFCKRPGRSNEHIWPIWAHALIGSDARGFSIAKATHDIRTKEIRVDKTVYRPQSRATDYVVRAVCKKCNNTWMSAIEEQAKPLLTPMILGNSVCYGGAELDALINWVVLKMFLIEQLDTAAFRHSDEQAHRFFLNRTVPDELQIYPFASDDREWACKLSMTNTGPSLQGDGACMSILGIGHVVFFMAQLPIWDGQPCPPLFINLLERRLLPKEDPFYWPGSRLEPGQINKMINGLRSAMFAA